MIRPDHKKKTPEMKSKGELQARQGARYALGGMQREFALAAVIRLVVIAVCPPTNNLPLRGGRRIPLATVDYLQDPPSSFPQDDLYQKFDLISQLFHVDLCKRVHFGAQAVTQGVPGI